ncbi:MAG: hypothetical protein RIM72_19995 [Alphaproteobacteria bacterium]
MREDLEAFIKAFETIGYKECNNGDLEIDNEKIAIYSKNGKPTHAAKQVASGKWSSKLGNYFDIEHIETALDGPQYGKIALFMSRPKLTKR